MPATANKSVKAGKPAKKDKIEDLLDALTAAHAGGNEDEIKAARKKVAAYVKGLRTKAEAAKAG